jgi:hypothetical protein
MWLDLAVKCKLLKGAEELEEGDGDDDDEYPLGVCKPLRKCPPPPPTKNGRKKPRTLVGGQEAVQVRNLSDGSWQGFGYLRKREDIWHGKSKFGVLGLFKDKMTATQACDASVKKFASKLQQERYFERCQPLLRGVEHRKCELTPNSYAVHSLAHAFSPCTCSVQLQPTSSREFHFLDCEVTD